MRCSLAPLPALAFAADNAKPVRLGHFPNLTHAQALMARATGEYEKKIGVPIEWSSFNAGPTAIEALFGNSTDAVYVGPSPSINVVTGIKLGWTLGWHGAVSAELIKSTVGLGFLLYMGRELNHAAQMLAIMLLTIVFGLLLDRFLFGLTELRIRKRWGLVATH